MQETVFDRMALSRCPVRRNTIRKNLPVTRVVEQGETSCELIPRPVRTVGAAAANADRRYISIRRLCWGLAALAVLVVCAAAVGTLYLEKHDSRRTISRAARHRRSGSISTGQKISADATTTLHERSICCRTRGSWRWSSAQLDFAGLKGAPAFRDNAYLSGFGFIPDGAYYGLRPDGLLVNAARATSNMSIPTPTAGLSPRTHLRGLYHTGELFYQDKAIRINAVMPGLDGLFTKSSARRSTSPSPGPTSIRCAFTASPIACWARTIPVRTASGCVRT